MDLRVSPVARLGGIHTRSRGAPFELRALYQILELLERYFVHDILNDLPKVFFRYAGKYQGKLAPDVIRLDITAPQKRHRR